MYAIYELAPGQGFRCECVIQDGTERWTKPTLDQAYHSLISGAYVLNHARIRRDDVEYVPYVMPLAPTCTADERRLLDEIGRGAKVVLDNNCKLLECRVTDEELDLIVAIREGRALVSELVTE